LFFWQPWKLKTANGAKAQKKNTQQQRVLRVVLVTLVSWIVKVGNGKSSLLLFFLQAWKLKSANGVET